MNKRKIIKPSGVTGRFDNKKSGYRESWQDGKLDGRIKAESISVRAVEPAFGHYPDLPKGK